MSGENPRPPIKSGEFRLFLDGEEASHFLIQQKNTADSVAATQKMIAERVLPQLDDLQIDRRTTNELVERLIKGDHLELAGVKADVAAIKADVSGIDTRLREVEKRPALPPAVPRESRPTSGLTSRIVTGSFATRLKIAAIAFALMLAASGVTLATAAALR